MHHILSLDRIQLVQPGQSGTVEEIATMTDCIRIGKRELWRHVSPDGKPPAKTESPVDVIHASRKGKQQLDEEVEAILYPRDEPDEASPDEFSSRLKLAGTDAGDLDFVGQVATEGTSSVKARRGTATYVVGGYLMYVVTRGILESDGKKQVRMRIYIPSLGCLGLGVRGIVFLKDSNCENCINSPLCTDGKLLRYFGNQIFPNAVFISDALTGKPHLVHNTTAENVIRNRKHIDEIGLEMQGRVGDGSSGVYQKTR